MELESVIQGWGFGAKVPASPVSSDTSPLPITKCVI